MTTHSVTSSETTSPGASLDGKIVFLLKLFMWFVGLRTGMTYIVVDGGWVVGF
jgi:hypothetical protein